MNVDFLRVIAAAPEDRRGLFLATANRLGTPLQNVEKDFWVSWVLDLLFNGSVADEPRLLPKRSESDSPQLVPDPAPATMQVQVPPLDQCSKVLLERISTCASQLDGFADRHAAMLSGKFDNLQ